ncbi:hypothetical protein T459_08862 [Capsicum annuum]|uniref:Uncharacterized protein n=1 Tax=Capsicum annuum TaxID=4072 RepID=A0A2G2ZXR5_CAPAN|nr:hypothetical protein T459_08862 [Capsicum annuum]
MGQNSDSQCFVMDVDKKAEYIQITFGILIFLRKSLKRSRKFQPEDRLFSLSSVTSPAAEEQALGRDGGGISANGPGRQRKGRGGPRDAKRMRHSSEPDYDYEDDPDLM